MASRALSFILGLGIVGLLGSGVALSDERARICRPGFSETLRLHGQAYFRMRDAAFARAGIPVSAQCHRDDPRPDCYILDHIIELSLDPPNPNSPDNLQVQTRIAAALKDQEERATHAAYCAGTLTQEEAWSNFKRTVP